MSKAPMVIDAVLGELPITLVASPEAVHVTLYGEKITAEQLRKLAYKLDKLEEARDVFFEMQEYAVNFTPVSGDYSEDSVIIKASSEQEALLAFDKMKLGKAKSVYNRVTEITNQV